MMEMPEFSVGDHSYIGCLQIPDLSLSLPVMSGWSYPDLKLSPCRFAGSAYRGDMIICAHNYRVHFRRIGELKAGAEVVFTDVQGNEFRYSVAEKEVLFPNEADRLRSGDWDLTLFTCTLGGKTRIVVRCVLEGK